MAALKDGRLRFQKRSDALVLIAWCLLLGQQVAPRFVAKKMKRKRGVLLIQITIEINKKQRDLLYIRCSPLALKTDWNIKMKVTVKLITSLLNRHE